VGILFCAVSALAAGTADFVRSLPPKETATEADAVRSAAIFLGEREGADDSAACEARVRDARLLKDGEAYEPGRLLRKGFAAMLFARGMGLKGGWLGRLSKKLGPRTAYKELEFLDMVPPMGEGDPMTGSELLALLKLSQDHMKSEAAEKAHVKEYRQRRRERYRGR
jgi:hypothetical protein